MDLPSISQSLQFYTAPSSPIQLEAESDSKDIDFKFKVTTRMFANRCEFQQTYPAFWWTTRRDNNEQKNYQLPSRARSFCSGEVLPLKPPPRLNTSVSSSPRSPNSLLKIPFSRPCAWNDDFDPFQFALEKVSDETRARMSFHRRSHSYSAYKTSSVGHWLDGSVDRNKEHHKHGPSNKSNIFDPASGYGHLGLRPSENLKPRGPTLAKMTECRESVYSRQAGLSEAIAKPKSKSTLMIRTKTKGLWLGRRVKEDDHEPMKAQCESNCTESKMQRVISFLFKLKSGSKERKRSMKLRRCLGYAHGSPPFMK